MARVLIVGCGCRGQALARDLCAAGHAVRGTTRDPARGDAIAAAGAEPYVGDPDRIATLMEALAGVTIVCWLMGTATGDADRVSALHDGRLRMLWEKLVDTPVRGVLHEAAGPLAPEVCHVAARSPRPRTRRGGYRSSCSRPTPPTTSPGAATRAPQSRGSSAADRTSAMDPDEIEFSVDVGGGPDGSVIAPRGELDMATQGELRTAIEQQAARGAVTLDLSGLRFLDTSGLRLVLETAEAARTKGFAFTVLPGIPAVQRLFDVAGVTELVPFATPEEGDSP